MKALMRGVLRRPPVIVSKTGMLTDPDAPQIVAAREALLDEIRSAPEGSVVPLSLDGIALSASCAAAVLVPALSEIVLGHVRGRFVLVEDPSGRNKWDGDAGLRKESERLGRKLVCVWQTKETDLAGAVDPQVRSTYEFVLGKWRTGGDGATARELAEHFEVSIQAASNRLSKAVGLGLLFDADRETVSGGGAQYVFVPVV